MIDSIRAAGFSPNFSLVILLTPCCITDSLIVYRALSGYVACAMPSRFRALAWRAVGCVRTKNSNSTQLFQEVKSLLYI